MFKKQLTNIKPLLFNVTKKDNVSIEHFRYSTPPKTLLAVFCLLSATLILSAMFVHASGTEKELPYGARETDCLIYDDVRNQYICWQSGYEHVKWVKDNNSLGDAVNTPTKEFMEWKEKNENEFNGNVTSPTTLRDKFGLGHCRFVNEHHAIPSKNLKWVAYDIACEKGVEFNVKSPGNYIIESIGYGTNLGNYIILVRMDTASANRTNDRIVLGHTATTLKVGAILVEGDVVGLTNVSGASTGMHVHIELWEGHMNVTRGALLGEEYSKTDGRRLLDNRNWDFGGDGASEIYYFTAYNLGDVNQNDSTPCIGASGKDLCYLEKSGVRTMALTSDIRKTLGISFGDSVRLTGDEGCEGVYQVEDEMNKRFRQTPGILRPGTNYYIKGDLPSKKGGACSITPL